MELVSLLWLCVTCVCVLFSFFGVPYTTRHYFDHKNHLLSQTIISTSFTAPRPNVWLDLTDTESAELIEYLYVQNPSLGLTRAANASSWDNSIVSLEALSPNKKDTLPFLDDHGALPTRYARVVVNQGASESAFFCEYQVGPLPITDSSSIVPLINGHTSGEHCVPNPLPDMMAMQEWFQNEALEMQEVLATLLGEAVIYGEDGVMKNLMLGGRMQRSQRTDNPHHTHLWTELHTKSSAFSLLPQGLYFQLDVTSRNMSNWQILSCYYNGKMYASIQELHNAAKRPGFRKSVTNVNDGWVDTVDWSSANEHDNEAPPPIMVQPGGPRYKYDAQQQFVSWKGFEFYFTSRAGNAMALYDIRFRGERIMYELGLQEALAAYSAANPVQSGQAFMDTFYNMGLLMFDLVPGYDAPAYATFVDTNYHVKETKWTNQNSIAIFEYTADHPLQRHTTETYTSISRNTYLVVKSVSTIGNYDYTIEYIFFLDGTIEVKVRASGYIFSAFFDDASRADLGDFGEDEYGYKVHGVISGSMHDHVLNFKADLDIGGQQNSLVKVDIEATNKTFPWDSEIESPRHTMHLSTVPITEEAGLDWPKNSAAMYIVHGNETRNRWGERRGYRIAPGTGMGTPPHLTIENSTNLESATQWASHDLWVLRQKDSEPKSAHERNVLDPGNPMVDFSTFVNGESIVEEDLVIYFNLGAHHVPHAGDIPNTLMHTSASSVMFIPHNFHDRDVSRETSQGVLIEKDSNKGSNPRYYGGRNTAGVKLNATQLEPDLSEYGGGKDMRGMRDKAMSESGLGFAV